MDNNSLGFASKFISSDLLFGEAFKIILDFLYGGHVMFFGVNVW